MSKFEDLIAIHPGELFFSRTFTSLDLPRVEHLAGVKGWSSLMAPKWSQRWRLLLFFLGETKSMRLLKENKPSRWPLSLLPCSTSGLYNTAALTNGQNRIEIELDVHFNGKANKLDNHTCRVQIQDQCAIPVLCEAGAWQSGAKFFRRGLW